MRRAIAGLVLGTLVTLGGYAAARSCAEVRAETVQLELVEVTEDGQPVTDRTAYAGATVRVHSTGREVKLAASTPAKWIWSEAYAR